MRNSLGYQIVTINGVSPKTHFAQVMVEADYRMKLIGIGLETPPVRLVSYVDRAKPSESNGLRRWYFVPDYQCVRQSDDRLAMELVGDGVKLVGEDEVVTGSGERKAAAGRGSKASQAFVASFTKKYPELADRSPVYAELRNLIDLAVAAAYIQQQGYYDKAGWKMEFFGSEKAFPVETYDIPKTVESAVNVISRRATLMSFPVGGGVTIHAAEALESENLLPDKKGTVSKLHAEIKPEPGQGPVVVGLASTTESATLASAPRIAYCWSRLYASRSSPPRAGRRHSSASGPSSAGRPAARRTGRRRCGQDNRPGRDFAAARRPARRRPSTAPAASVGPSSPSVPPESKATAASAAVVHQPQQRGQHQLLVSPAQPAARRFDQLHHRLAAADQAVGHDIRVAAAARRPPAHLQCRLGQIAADVLGRSFRLRRARGRNRVAEPPRFLGRGGNRRGVVADDEIARAAGRLAAGIPSASRRCGADGPRLLRHAICSSQILEHRRRDAGLLARETVPARPARPAGWRNRARSGRRRSRPAGRRARRR